MNYIILIFQSTHRTLLAEKVLLGHGIKFDIIPTPKEITSDCGMAIRINPSLTNKGMVISILNDSKIDFNLYEKWMQ
ncbi:MAG: DUF3343 domain-containing protein [Bacteroidales bacterium]|nr:MAG: DUF3343 domain-containing protein [Bacteroidales bacterium]